jgi:predicted nucleotidyltransferase
MDRLPPHLVDVIAQLRQGLQELYGDRFRDLLLYGSYARGDARVGSDIDLLILLKGPVNTSQEISRIVDLSAPLSLDHGVLLSVMPVSEEAYEKGDTAFLRNVRREAVQAA